MSEQDQGGSVAAEGAGDQRVFTVQLPLVWSADDDLVQFANQGLVQFHEGHYIVSFGQATPPPILGSPEEQKNLMEQVPFIEVRPIVRLALSPAVAKAIVRILAENIEKIEALQGQET